MNKSDLKFALQTINRYYNIDGSNVRVTDSSLTVEDYDSGRVIRSYEVGHPDELVMLLTGMLEVIRTMSYE